MPMQKLHLGTLDYAILLTYFVCVLALGWWLKRRMKGGDDFLLSGRSLPAWVTGLAFLSANLGALEVIGMAASGAKYGMMTCHFYWIGAIPAMVFLSVFMMPFYYGSKARSVPEYLKFRFDEKTRAFNATSFAVKTILSSGISLHVMAKLFETLVGWNYHVCIAVSAAIVLVYVLLGGLTAAIYNEVFQFVMILIGFAPLAFIALRDVGGWDGLRQKLDVVAANQHFAPGTWSELWRHTGSPADNPMGVGWFGMVMGLGFVLSFGYWCVDFSVIQRAMAARSMSAARRTPLIAAFPKLIFPALIILPGLIAMALNSGDGGNFLPQAADGQPDYNMAIPMMLKHYYSTGLLGIGFTALMASFMSGLAGNVTAFNTVWTYDIYQSYLARNRSDRHYLWVGRVATVCGILLSMAAAYLASRYDNIMDLIQLVAGFVNAPLFATFLLGMFWKRATGHGAFAGLVGGTLGAALLHGLSLAEGATAGIKGGWLAAPLHFHSAMGQNFCIATVSWTCCFALTILVSLATRRNKSDAELSGLVYSLTSRLAADREPWHRRPAVLGGIVLVAMLVLNYVFR